MRLPLVQTSALTNYQMSRNVSTEEDIELIATKDLFVYLPYPFIGLLGLINLQKALLRPSGGRLLHSFCFTHAGRESDTQICGPCAASCLVLLRSFGIILMDNMTCARDGRQG